MPTLAIAGGTSAGLGRAIVTAVLSSQHPTKWDTIILSRTQKPPLWLQAVDPEGSRSRLHAVDYTSVDSLVPALQGVDTVISATAAVDGSQAQVQMNLLHAAIKAGCRRFAPSQWGMGPRSYETGIMKILNDRVGEECLKHQDKIECGLFNNGMFMNYFGYGIFPPQSKMDNEEEILQKLREGGGYMAGADTAIEGVAPLGDLKDRSGAFLISLKNAVAELPVREGGEWPRFTATSIRDVGRLVAASLNVPKWEMDMSMAGDTITMGELLDMAKAISGNHAFEVEKLTTAILQEKSSALEEHQMMEGLWLEFKLKYCADLDGEGVLAPVVNRMCPEVKPMTVQEYLSTHWSLRHT